jgi:hypothetical protein
MRFINFVRLQITTKSSVLLDVEYLKAQGFKFKNRNLDETVKALCQSGLVQLSDNCEPTVSQQSANSEPTVRTTPLDTKPVKTKTVTQIREEKNRIDNIQSVFNFWNNTNLTSHRDLSKFKSHINNALELYNLEEITNAIQNYDEITASKDYWYNNRIWSLSDFLARKNGIDLFLSANNPWKKYENTQNAYQTQGEKRVEHERNHTAL